MRRRTPISTPARIAVASLLLAVPIRSATAAPGDELPARQKLQEMYVSYLREEGYDPTIDADGDVQFKMAGVPYLILIVENDPEFFEILMPNFWPLESEAERARALAAADHANATIKVAKVYTLGDNVSAVTELFVPQPEDFKKVFRRSLLAVSAAVEAFVEQMQKHDPNERGSQAAPTPRPPGPPAVGSSSTSTGTGRSSCG